MGVSGRNIDDFQLVAAHEIFINLFFVRLAEANNPFAVDDEELFVLRMMPMLPFGNPRLGDIDGELAAVGRAKNFRKGAAMVAVHIERIAELIGRQIAQIGRVELLNERIGHVGHAPLFPGRAERTEQVGDPAELNGMRYGHGAVFSVFGAVLVSGRSRNELAHDVVDIRERENDVRVVDLDREIVRDIIAEGRHDAVVVRPAPFPKQIREPIDENLRARLFSVREHELFARLFRLAVRIVERRLSRRRDHDGAVVPVLFERVEERRGESEIAGHELGGILGPVHAREIKDEIGFRAVFVEERGVRVDVVLQDGQVGGQVVRLRLAVPNIAKFRAEIFADKSFRARY